MPTKRLFTPKYTIPALLVTIGALLSIWNISNPFWSSTIAFVYLLFIGKSVGSIILPHERSLWRVLFGSIATLCLFLSAATLIYWFYRFDQVTASMLIILFPFLISLTHEHEEDMWQKIEDILDVTSFSFTKSYLGTRLLAFFFVWGETIMWYVLSTKRYTDTLVSPWTIIGPKFFLMFGILTAMLFWIAQKSRRFGGNITLITFHYLLILCVSQVIFVYGFGFDPFIHQATERWIDTNGFILPKQPYYLGQYMLTLLAHTLTHLPIDMIDKAWVPIGAALVPTCIYFVFSRQELQKSLSPAILFVPFIPLGFLTVTTPNNLGMLLAIFLIFWMWYEAKHTSKGSVLLSLSLISATIAIHPFIGIPLGIIYLGSHGISRTEPKTAKIALAGLYTAVLSLCIPVAIAFHAKLNHNVLHINNPLLSLEKFTSMFQPPYWYWFHAGNFQWQALYVYRMAIVPLAILIALVGMYISIKKYQNTRTHWQIATIIGLFFSAIWLSTAMTFPNVISYEQQVYAKRMLDLCLVFFLPFFIIAVREFFLWARRDEWLQLLSACCAALLLTVSWYFTYPTRDPVSHYTGFNVRHADIEAVHFIANRNKNTEIEYIVLSNQMVAAAALREFGFAKYFATPTGEHYFYSIPTGGPLYEFFRKMVYEEPRRKWMEDAMTYAGVKKAYFVHTNYWAPAAEIRDKAKKEADDWWDLDQGRVWVYEYIKK